QEDGHGGVAEVDRGEVGLAVVIEVSSCHAQSVGTASGVVARELEADAGHGPRLERLEGQTAGRRPVATGASGARNGQQGAQPLTEPHDSFSLSSVVCRGMAATCSGAQTERRGGAGPAGDLLGGKALPAVLIPVFTCRGLVGPTRPPPSGRERPSLLL